MSVYNHEPEDYICPFCRLAQGGATALTNQQDIVYRDDLVIALISPRWWPKNEGHVIIVPNEHFENIYDLPAKYAHRVQDIAREVAIAFKHLYRCDGVSTRQHNEPAGGQDVWHYHLHVFPRYTDDELYQSRPLREWATAEKRLVYAQKLRAYFSEHEIEG